VTVTSAKAALSHEFFSQGQLPGPMACMAGPELADIEVLKWAESIGLLKELRS
jgi:hypothetical protein